MLRSKQHRLSSPSRLALRRSHCRRCARGAASAGRTVGEVQRTSTWRGVATYGHVEPRTDVDAELVYDWRDKRLPAKIERLRVQAKDAPAAVGSA